MSVPLSFVSSLPVFWQRRGCFDFYKFGTFFIRFLGKIYLVGISGAESLVQSAAIRVFGR